jgi:hypothetical protein
MERNSYERNHIGGIGKRGFRAGSVTGAETQGKACAGKTQRLAERSIERSSTDLGYRRIWGYIRRRHCPNEMVDTMICTFISVLCILLGIGTLFCGVVGPGLGLLAVAGVFYFLSLVEFEIAAEKRRFREPAPLNYRPRS